MKTLSQKLNESLSSNSLKEALEKLLKTTIEDSKKKIIKRESQ